MIFGARSVEQLEANVRASDVALSDAHVTKLDEASNFDHGYPYDFMRTIQGKW